MSMRDWIEGVGPTRNLGRLLSFPAGTVWNARNHPEDTRYTYGFSPLDWANASRYQQGYDAGSQGLVSGLLEGAKALGYEGVKAAGEVIPGAVPYINRGLSALGQDSDLTLSPRGKNTGQAPTSPASLSNVTSDWAGIYAGLTGGPGPTLDWTPYTNPSTADKSLPHFSENVTVTDKPIPASVADTNPAFAANTANYFTGPSGAGANNQLPWAFINGAGGGAVPWNPNLGNDAYRRFNTSGSAATAFPWSTGEWSGWDWTGTPRRE